MAREISAFTTPAWSFSYSIRPFGLCNGQDYVWVCWLYCLFGWCGSSQQYLVRSSPAPWSTVWPSCWSQPINVYKCKSANAAITYLGRVVGQGEVRPVWAKVEVVYNYLVPTNKNNSWDFEDWQATIAVPTVIFVAMALLTDPLKKNTKFVW